MSSSIFQATLNHVNRVVSSLAGAGLVSDAERNYAVDKIVKRASSASYIAHSFKFLSPYFFSKLFGRNSRSFGNVLLINSVVGQALVVYSRKHMRRAGGAWQAFGYSLFVSTVFNLASVLFWMLCKTTILPSSELLLAAYGVCSGLALLSTANAYLNIIDRNE